MSEAQIQISGCPDANDEYNSIVKSARLILGTILSLEKDGRVEELMEYCKKNRTQIEFILGCEGNEEQKEDFRMKVAEFL